MSTDFIEQTRVAALAHISEQGISKNAAAREAGINSGAFSTFLNSKYTGDNNRIAEDLDRWLKAHARLNAEAQRFPTGPDFINTETAQRIENALTYAQMAADMAVIYGGAGLGKTKAISRYAAHNPSVWVCTMSPATASTAAALEEVSAALGLNVANGAARMHRAIVAKLRGTHGVLIIDEAQHLSISALDEMRSLFDAAEVGLVLCGNEEVYTRLTGGNRAAYLSRLFSRIGKRLKLNKPLKADVIAIADGWKCGRDCHALLRDIASKPGALRAVNKTLRLATMYATGSNQTINPDHIVAAWKELGGAE